MSNKKLRRECLDCLVIFFICWMIFADVITETVISPQTSLYGTKTVLLIFGILCFILGIHVSASLSRYGRFDWLAKTDILMEASVQKED